MIEKNKLYNIWVYLQAEPLFWLTLTIGAFLIGDYFYKKSKLNPLVNPVAISILIVASVLIATDVSYERYFNGAKFIHFMLGPATVALAIPIYKQIHLIKKESGSIFISLILGSLFAIFSTYFFAKLMNLDLEIIYSMMPRSVTAPIAMGISELIGGVPSLTAIITIITGIVGASFGTFALDVLRVKDMTARGFAFGLASHGIGTARAMSKNETAGIFAALALGLSGIATSILIPLLFKLINF
jgi:predicted murein hydrolase (TIGR00659 family)|tara:strand:+ start:1833 stop:2561 length:729 start_codon:yes stop_codon:yes gene_type:complete